jgi:hypothetical protein
VQVPDAAWPVVQILYKVYEDAELKPILDTVNAEQSKEKEKES